MIIRAWKVLFSYAKKIVAKKLLTKQLESGKKGKKGGKFHHAFEVFIHLPEVSKLTITRKISNEIVNIDY